MPLRAYSETLEDHPEYPQAPQCAKALNAANCPARKGCAAQLGFRLPNLVVSPFVRKHYVSHVPMDHIAIVKFVESRFINSGAHLTNRDAVQPDLLNFFDFTNAPWATPPTPPTPIAPPGSCNAQQM